MSDSLRAIRGMPDRDSVTIARHEKITNTLLKVASCYDFDLFDTPLLELYEVFARPLGGSSDIVSKEMYNLEDRQGNKMVLRPEFTAGIMRAVLSGKLYHQNPLRFCYQGSVFRYERPQSGRLRQFHQMGVEIIGDDSLLSDIACIASANACINALKLDNITLRLNTLGCDHSRKAYKNALVEYLNPLSSKLSEASQTRLTKNPLRILDSKDQDDQKILENAPNIMDFLTDQSREGFAYITKGLDELEISFQHDPKLVRGLDYYSHTVFEFESSALGAKSTVLAGGRYDGLAKILGGDSLPAIGWSAGIERLDLCKKAQKSKDNFEKPLKTAVIFSTKEEALYTMKVADNIRRAGLALKIFPAGSFKKRLAQVVKQGFASVILIGSEERDNKTVKFKDLKNFQEEIVNLESIAAKIKKQEQA